MDAPTVTGSPQSLNPQPQKQEIGQVLQALNAIYDPHTSNDNRREATVFLEQVKTQPDAPTLGFQLASDISQNPTVRHYGLSMLEYTVKYSWQEGHNDARNATVRHWTWQLAQSLNQDDSVFLRNKVAQLWVELAKRCWLSDWDNMDEMLCKLWQGSATHKALVLHVLETIAEEFLAKDAHASSDHGSELGRACVEIFTPASTLAESFPGRDIGLSVRHGQEGWIQRLILHLQVMLSGHGSDKSSFQGCIQLLAVLRAAMPWIVLPSLTDTPLIELLCKALQVNDVAVQTTSLEVFHALYHRSQYSDRDVVTLICPMMSSQGVKLLRENYSSSQVGVEDVEEPQYLHLKKLSEVMCALASFLEQRPNLVVANSDIPATLDLLMLILQDPSLVVSIPVLYSWTKILACPSPSVSDQVVRMIGGLLEVCSLRLMRYEALSADTSDATFLFLSEDFDTMPERHVFVGNYRRFCTEVVQKIVLKSPFEAIRHILGQADNLVQSLDQQQSEFEAKSYSSNSLEILRIDAQATVVMSALKGYLGWYQGQTSDKAQTDVAHQQLQQDLEQWCTNLLQRRFKDPIVQKRLLQLIGDITTTTLSTGSALPLGIAEHVLTGPRALDGTFDQNQEHSIYHEAWNDLQSSYPRLLQKLAIKHADAFIPVFSDLQQSIEKIRNDNGIDPRNHAEYQAVLFTIIHRSTTMDEGEQAKRMHEILEPCVAVWKDESFGKALSDFGGFCELLSLDQVPQYFMHHEAHRIQDWSTVQLDSQGTNFRDGIQKKHGTLPLLATRALLSVSTERIRRGTREFKLILNESHQFIPTILPNLLQLISHAHAFSNPSKWSNFPNEMQIIIRKTLIDRVWQSGISAESRDDFYAKVRSSKKTLEGLASATRGAVRQVRELSYWILHCLSYFGHELYRHEDLPEPLAHALFDDAFTLSSHQMATLLKLAIALTEGCPPEARQNFLPPPLSNLFKQLDTKISAEWEVVQANMNNEANDESLDREMKTESVLRQLTWSATTFTSSILAAPGQGAFSPPTNEPYEQTSRYITLSSTSILSNLIPFCAHLISVPDSRSVSLITKVLRSILGEYARHTNNQGRDDSAHSGPDAIRQQAASVLEYFASDIFKSAINSLHEPYFADLQKDLASLIAQILTCTSPHTDTPRSLLISLPGMSANKVDNALKTLQELKSERQQRGLVLDLLEGLRGVSIPEQGRILASTASANAPSRRSRKSAMQEQFAMALDDDTTRGPKTDGGLNRGGSPELAGMAEMFG